MPSNYRERTKKVLKNWGYFGIVRNKFIGCWYTKDNMLLKQYVDITYF